MTWVLGEKHVWCFLFSPEDNDSWRCRAGGCSFFTDLLIKGGTKQGPLRSWKAPGEPQSSRIQTICKHWWGEGQVSERSAAWEMNRCSSGGSRAKQNEMLLFSEMVDSLTLAVDGITLMFWVSALASGAVELS